MQLSNAEAQYVEMAKEHIIMARMDKAEPSGPVLERAEGSIVWDVNGKSYIDFNSGQMCSALGQESKVIESIQKGAKDFVVKPFQPAHLLEAVGKALA